MNALDLSTDPKVIRLTKLIEDLKRSHSPDETMLALQTGFTAEGEPTTTLFLSNRGLSNDQFIIVRTSLGEHDSTLKIGRVCQGGVVPGILARRAPQLLEEVDWSEDPHFRNLLVGHASVIAIPFSSERLPINWVLLLTKWPRRFGVTDMQNALERVALGGTLIENQILAYELTLANAKIDQEARQVGELQRALLPASVPQIAGLEIATSYKPSGRAGGDLYDFFPLDPISNGSPSVSNRWCIFIGDASGHGLAAAVVMAIVQAVLRAHPKDVSGPASLLKHANQQLCEKQIGGFFTAFLGIYEPALRRFVYSNAGHPPPLVKSASDRCIRCLNDAVSYPLGIDESEEFTEAVAQLQCDDIVLVYTDGITEARSVDDIMFERDALQYTFQEAGGSPADLVEQIRGAVRAHEGELPVADDQTIVIARIL